MVALSKIQQMMNFDWQERTRLMLGEEGIQKLQQSHILVAGLGGVGAMAAEMLCRAGIGKITIADADKVQASNRNRQIPALCSTEKMDKTAVMAERLLDINPDVRINIVNAYLKDQTIIDLLSPSYDYVVDAIDTLSPKVYFIYHALKTNQRLVSSMGAGGKLNPGMVQIADLSETFQCKLAFDLRKRLRRLGVTAGFKAVFSSEPVPAETIIKTEDERNKKSNVGTISYMPAVFGCFCASVVIRDLIST
jgi:tRNA threonylcarbamoyladenosine dehydratase